MSDPGLSKIEQKINEIENLLDEMRTATIEAHTALKDLKSQKKAIEKLLDGKELKTLVKDHVDLVVSRELDKIMPVMKEHTDQIYEKVGSEVDKLINLMLGSEFSTRRGQPDLRPILAAKLRIWIREIIAIEGELP